MHDLFLINPSMVFLNHASFGACPADVFAIYPKWRRELEKNPVEFLGWRSAALLAESRSALGADFYPGNCHKWLCAPKGAGFLYARPEHRAWLEAPIISGGYCTQISGHTGFEAYTGQSLFERRLQWQGTRDIAAFLSVPAAIRFQERHNWDKVRRVCHALAKKTLDRIYALTGLNPICDDKNFGQMAAIPVPDRGSGDIPRRPAFYPSFPARVQHS